MLVDLARNDLGRVCVPGSVRAHRADGGRTVLQGDAHRLDGRGRPPPRHGAVRRPRRDVPRGHGDRRAQAPGDGADRRARADPAGPVRRRGGLPHVRRRPRLLHHDPNGGGGRRPRQHPGRRRHRGRLRPRDRAARDEGQGRGPAARRRPDRRRHTDDPGRRPLRLVHLQPRAADREPRARDDGREVRRAPAEELVGCRPDAVVCRRGRGTRATRGASPSCSDQLPRDDPRARRLPGPPGDRARAGGTVERPHRCMASLAGPPRRRRGILAGVT